MRWGPAGHLAQHKTYPATALDRVGKTCQQKRLKGYVLLGERALDDRGRVLGQSISATQPPPAAPPARPQTRAGPGIDLSRIETTIANDWF